MGSPKQEMKKCATRRLFNLFPSSRSLSTSIKSTTWWVDSSISGIDEKSEEYKITITFSFSSNVPYLCETGVTNLYFWSCQAFSQSADDISWAYRWNVQLAEGKNQNLLGSRSKLITWSISAKRPVTKPSRVGTRFSVRRFTCHGKIHKVSTKLGTAYLRGCW